MNFLKDLIKCMICGRSHLSLAPPLFTFPQSLLMIMPGLPSTEFEIQFHLHWNQSGI